MHGNVRRVLAVLGLLFVILVTPILMNRAVWCWTYGGYSKSRIVKASPELPVVVFVDMQGAQHALIVQHGSLDELPKSADISYLPDATPGIGSRVRVQPVSKSEYLLSTRQRIGFHGDYTILGLRKGLRYVRVLSNDMEVRYVHWYLTDGKSVVPQYAYARPRDTLFLTGLLSLPVYVVAFLLFVVMHRGGKYRD